MEQPPIAGVSRSRRRTKAEAAKYRRIRDDGYLPEGIHRCTEAELTSDSGLRVGDGDD